MVGHCHWRVLARDDRHNGNAGKRSCGCLSGALGGYHLRRSCCGRWASHSGIDTCDPTIPASPGWPVRVHGDVRRGRDVPTHGRQPGRSFPRARHSSGCRIRPRGIDRLASNRADCGDQRPTIPVRQRHRAWSLVDRRTIRTTSFRTGYDAVIVAVSRATARPSPHIGRAAAMHPVCHLSRQRFSRRPCGHPLGGDHMVDYWISLRRNVNTARTLRCSPSSLSSLSLLNIRLVCFSTAPSLTTSCCAMRAFV